MYKHYIKIDKDNRIIDGYSTAEKEPGEGDICVYEGRNPHFPHVWLDIWGVPQFEYVKGEIEKREYTNDEHNYIATQKEKMRLLYSNVELDALTEFSETGMVSEATKQKLKDKKRAITE